MKIRIPKFPTKWLWLGGTLAVVVIGAFTSQHWWPMTTNWVNHTVAYFRTGEQTPGAESEVSNADATDPHAGHDHAAHGGHDEATSLELSSQALRNVGLSPDQIQPVKLETFQKSITVPAVIVERPGRTVIKVATPMTGVVKQVHAVQGEAVEPGSILFQIRLTHEDLVQAQTRFLEALGELDVEQREIARLQEVTRSGAVAGKILLNREYARDKLNSSLRAMREGLRLHGLSNRQIDQMASERRLLRELQIVVPSADDEEIDQLRLSQQPVRPVGFTQVSSLAPDTSTPPTTPTPLVLQQVNVFKGQSVKAGETLCSIADYQELYIEGLAFEQDVNQLRRTSEEGWKVDALFGQANPDTKTVQGLEIAYLSNQIDTESRTLKFYVRLPNIVAKDRRDNDDRFVEWKYLPGQRLQLRIPVEEWQEQIVLPVEAVANEGAESFVFQQNGAHFDRVPVHVKYRDQHSAVIENDGSIFPGDVVARRGAHQLQMALKNKAGGGVDPHAGHNH